MDTSKNELLRMAIVGCRKQIGDLQDAIKTYEQMLGDAPATAPLASVGRPRSVSPVATAATPAKRKMSPAARRRISAATKERWAKYRAAKSATAASTV